MDLLPMNDDCDAHDHVEGEDSSDSEDCFAYTCEYEDVTTEDNGNNAEHYDAAAKDASRLSPHASPSGFIIYDLPPPPRPQGGSKIVTAADPSCTSISSPQSDTIPPKSWKKWGCRDRGPNPWIGSLLCRQHSEAMTPLAAQKAMGLPRSKSCGDGMWSAPTVDFELWARCFIPRDGKRNADDSRGGDVDLDAGHLANEVLDHKKRTSSSSHGFVEERFKCGPFCMSLRGLSRGKHASFKGRRKDTVVSDAASRIASLDKFECGSWASSVVQHRRENKDDDKYSGDDDGEDVYYDLPLEKLTGEHNDTNSPVKAAFVFERDGKGVLKSEDSEPSTRPSAPRHVRFLTSTHASCPPSPSKLVAEHGANERREHHGVYLQAMD